MKCLNTPEGKTAYSWRWERNCHNRAVRWVIKMGTTAHTLMQTVLQCIHTAALFWTREWWLDFFNICTCRKSLRNNVQMRKKNKQADTLTKAYKNALELAIFLMANLIVYKDLNLKLLIDILAIRDRLSRGRRSTFLHCKMLEKEIKVF